MVNFIVGGHAFLFIIIRSSGIQVSGKAREIAAGYLYSDTMSFLKIVAGSQRRELQFVNFALLHKHFPVIAFAIASPKDGFVQVIGGSIRIYINKLDRKVSIFGIRGNVERRLNKAGDFHPGFKRFGGINQHIITGLYSPLIKGSAFNGVTRAAYIAAVRGDGVHGIVGKFVRFILLVWFI